MRHTIAITALFSSVFACNGEEPFADSIESAIAGGCQIVPGPVIGPGPGSGFRISPKSTILDSGVVAFFPRLLRVGSWTTAQFVADSNGLTIPALTANGTAAGWLDVPFDATRQIVGVSLNICGDGTTILAADTFATQFSNPQRDNFTDGIVGTGSLGTGGTPQVWHTVDIEMQPLALTEASTVWMDMSAIQTSTAVPTPPPSMAVSQIIVHYQ